MLDIRVIIVTDENLRVMKCIPFKDELDIRKHKMISSFIFINVRKYFIYNIFTSFTKQKLLSFRRQSQKLQL